MPCMTADKILQEKITPDKIDIKCGFRVEAIRGDSHVKSLDIVDSKGQKSS